MIGFFRPVTKARKFLLGISQRLLARYTARTTRHLMEICHHWKNDRTDAGLNGYKNEIAVCAHGRLDHSSDIALWVGHIAAISLLSMGAIL
jgi:hypothetical protein